MKKSLGCLRLFYFFISLFLEQSLRCPTCTRTVLSVVVGSRGHFSQDARGYTSEISSSSHRTRASFQFPPFLIPSPSTNDHHQQGDQPRYSMLQRVFYDYLMWRSNFAILHLISCVIGATSTATTSLQHPQRRGFPSNHGDFDLLPTLTIHHQFGYRAIVFISLLPQCHRADGAWLAWPTTARVRCINR